MAVANTNFLSFLALRTASYLLFADGSHSKALDILGLPQEVRFDLAEADGEGLQQLGEWADPKMPNILGEGDEAKYDADALERLFNDAG